MTLDEIIQDFDKLSQKSYRAKQVYKWLCGGAESFAEMTNLPKDFRETLNEYYFIPSISVESKRVASDGTIKYLFKLYDGEFVESVLMKYNHGYSICISTQVGCKMGCSFCATGKSGYKRNLNASEMLGQIYAAQDDEKIKISNVVLMGMGEPLDNYDNVIKFLKLVSEPDGLNIGHRHISVSTCGLVDKIYKLADENLQITLSISLHAPNDELRSSMMRINNRWNINDLITACKYYTKKTHRRISFEYTMVNNVNDDKGCALQLADLLKGMLCHVNLIPLNDSQTDDLKRSNIRKIYFFRDFLQSHGINATVRRTLGKDIEAACGQLKGKHLSQESLKGVE